MRWKSVGTPVSGPWAAAEYMHIGDIHTRLGIRSERRVKGVNRLLMQVVLLSWSVITGRAGCRPVSGDDRVEACASGA